MSKYRDNGMYIPHESPRMPCVTVPHYKDERVKENIKYPYNSLSDVAESIRDSIGKMFYRLANLKYKDVKIIVNGKATILIIGDKKTVVKCTDGERLDIEKGIAMALLKHVGMTRGDMARLIKSVDNQNIKENE